jgi:hypothetical protein
MTMLQQFRHDPQQASASRSTADRDGLDASGVEISLNAAILSIQDDQPQVLLVRPTGDQTQRQDALPSGPYLPLDHGTLENSLRYWVERQTGLPLGYAEQLYTFTSRSKPVTGELPETPTVAVGYLALARIADAQDLAGGLWRNWYVHFPWEDWRNGKPAILTDEIEPWLRERSSPEAGAGRASWDRIRVCFGLDGASWDEERVLERFEFLFEAGLIGEAVRDGMIGEQNLSTPRVGQMLRGDHRRVLAAALGRLRAKIKYRPVIFELMAREFTLFELQKTVEAILGSHLHKQNFRRLVEGTGLVEATTDVRTHTGGRPAKLFRFRREVLMERPAPGVRVKVSAGLGVHSA